jgi:alpha-tubulin suppressor-like RCC1 family protein
MHTMPRFCSYNIPIAQIACGAKHTVFITSKSHLFIQYFCAAQYLCYAMGANNQGQLGINEPYVESKCSPVLVRGLLDCAPVKVSCGSAHSLVQTRTGDVYSWGDNEFGQCGVTAKGESSGMQSIYQPSAVNFDDYYRPNIKEVSAGGHHSGFVDDIGRLFMCGKGEQG